MYRNTAKQSNLSAALNIIELIFHSAVYNVRKQNRNAIVGLLMSILQAVIFVAVFYVLLTLLGMRKAAIRGDFMLYILSGVYLFLTHNKALLAVAGSGSSTNTILNHAPLNTAILIAASALSVLYLQLLALFTILFCLHVFINPVVIDQPVYALITFLFAWGSGVANGLIFLAARPWAPAAVGVLKTVYTRANMISSGKMFVANSMPANLLVMFYWNPLFHTIDQARGFIFINYNPHNSSFWYPVWWCMGMVVIGMMAEFFTRRHASASWSAGK